MLGYLLVFRYSSISPNKIPDELVIIRSLSRTISSISSSKSFRSWLSELVLRLEKIVGGEVELLYISI